MSDSDLVSIPEREKPRDCNDYAGRTIKDYKVLEKLGEGTFGVVYVGERGGKKFALKLLPRNDSLLASTLQKELDAQKGLRHPNIREVYEFHSDAHFDDNGNEPLSLLVMEYVDGTHLKVAEVDDNAFYVIALQVKNALEAAHNQGIINKDVKPTNILVAKDGQAKVADFGLAKRVEEHSRQLEPSLPVTSDAPQRSLQSPGTYGYFPPGERADSPAYDLYSFGVTLYQMIMQKTEFPDADVYADVEKKATERGLENNTGLAHLVKMLTLKKHKRLKDFAEVEKTEGWKAIQKKAKEVLKYGKTAEALYADFKREIKASELEDKDDMDDLISHYYPDPERIPQLRENLAQLIQMERRAKENALLEKAGGNELEGSFQIYQRYILLLNKINPKKITDELADNIAYSAWKEGLDPEYVDFIVESIAQRREKGLLRRVKEELFGNKDDYFLCQGLSKQKIREKVREFVHTTRMDDRTKISTPEWFNDTLKHIKSAGKKYNVFVEDIIEEAVRCLAEAHARKAIEMPNDGTFYFGKNRALCLEELLLYGNRHRVFVEDIFDRGVKELEEKKHIEYTKEGLRFLQSRYSRAFKKRPDYDQLLTSTAKIAKKEKDTEYSYLDVGYSWPYYMLGSVIMSFVARQLSGNNSLIGGMGNGVGMCLGEAYVWYKKNKLKNKWEQQEEVQGSIDERVKKIIQGEKVEEIAPEEKAGLLRKIKSYLQRDLTADFDVTSIAVYIFGLPLLGGLTATTVAASTYPLREAVMAGETAISASLFYNVARLFLPVILSPKKNKESLTDKVAEAEQKEELPAEQTAVNPITGNEIHIFSPIGIASLKRVLSDAYNALRKKFSKEKETKADKLSDNVEQHEEIKAQNQELHDMIAHADEFNAHERGDYSSSKEETPEQTKQDLSEKLDARSLGEYAAKDLDALDLDEMLPEKMHADLAEMRRQTGDNEFAGHLAQNMLSHLRGMLRNPDAVSAEKAEEIRDAVMHIMDVLPIQEGDRLLANQAAKVVQAVNYIVGEREKTKITPEPATTEKPIQTEQIQSPPLQELTAPPVTKPVQEPNQETEDYEIEEDSGRKVRYE